MSGHNKWSQIKHRKGAQDAKKSALFSKLLPQISIAAKADQNPETNQRLRSLIEKAREANVPNDTITRAISRAQEQKDLKEFTFEAIGPEGIAILVEGITDNSNRTLQELRTLAQDVGLKPADPGSLQWAFAAPDGGARSASETRREPRPGTGRELIPKFPQPVSPETKKILQAALAELEMHDDVQRVITNAQ